MLGGEQSGHIIFRKYAHTGDGLITALMLMQVMIDTQLPLSVLASGVSMYPQVLKNVRVDDKDGTLADAAVQAAVDECTADLGDSGRVVLRKSGTEPVLRVMAEAGSPEECEMCIRDRHGAGRRDGAEPAASVSRSARRRQCGAQGRP